MLSRVRMWYALRRPGPWAALGASLPGLAYYSRGLPWRDCLSTAYYFNGKLRRNPNFAYNLTPKNPKNPPGRLENP